MQKEATTTFADETSLGDRLNVAFGSCKVTRGRARGVVYATGLCMEIGIIATTTLERRASRRRKVWRPLESVSGPADTRICRYPTAFVLTLANTMGHFLGVNVGTPLQQKLSRLAVYLLGCAVACTLVVLGANKFSSQREVVLYAVATGLSMLPVSLIVVLTVTMSSGSKKMAQRNVIVRDLKSVEALGSVTSMLLLLLLLPSILRSDKIPD